MQLVWQESLNPFFFFKSPNKGESTKTPQPQKVEELWSSFPFLTATPVCHSEYCSSFNSTNITSSNINYVRLLFSIVLD